METTNVQARGEVMAVAVARSTSPRLDVTTALAHTFLIILSLICGLPFVWMFLGTFKDFNELVLFPPTILPRHPTFNNYYEVLFQINLARALLNSVIQSGAVTISVLITSSLAGYVFAKYRFWGKDQLFVVLLSTMMVPFAVVLVPLYITVVDLKINNSLLGIIVPSLVSTFGIFLMRQFIENIPGELIDAGRIDGASETWIFFRVVIPLATSALAALAIFTFMWHWDSYLWPTIVLTSPEVKTTPIVLASLRSLFWTRYEIWVTGSMLTVLPVTLLYIFAQKHFIRGISLTGMKG
jgi:multiple sugar transport system permease protein